MKTETSRCWGFGVSHDRADGEMDSQARWFQSLSIPERIRVMNSMLELTLAGGHHLPRKPHAESVPGRVQVLESPEGEVRPTHPNLRKPRDGEPSANE